LIRLYRLGVGQQRIAAAATAEPTAIVTKPARQPAGLAAPPKKSSVSPTATGPRNPVE
jgi:hypothetical protein